MVARDPGRKAAEIIGWAPRGTAVFSSQSFPMFRSRGDNDYDKAIMAQETKWERPWVAICYLQLYKFQLALREAERERAKQRDFFSPELYVMVL